MVIKPEDVKPQLRREFKPCEPVKFCELYPIMLDDASAASYFRQR